jgi:hypothetical protein
MISIFWKATPAILISLIASIHTPVRANEMIDQVEKYSQEGNNNLNQVTNVNQLRDVSPTDWAYESLRSLVDRYGCIAGFPNQTYRGNQPLSRYEFAAGLNSCLSQIERLIASSESVVREDIDTINRLTQEFEAELATLGGRVDNLESRTAFLEDHQFSTTTKLEGEAIFAVGSVAAGSTNDGNDDIDKVPVLGDRLRLELNSSFTGDDVLFTRLSAGNFPSFSGETGTFQGDLAFAQEDDNDLGLEVLFYDLPIGDSTNVLIGAAGLAADDIANTVNILDGDGGSGAVSAFGTRSPIYLPPGETGLGIIHRLGEKIELSAGYLAGNANDPTEDNGLFGESYSAIGQILFTPTENINLAATYVHGRNQSDTGTGSNLANLQFLTETELNEAVPTVSDSYGVAASIAITDRIVIGGWGNLSKVSNLSTLGGQIDRGTQDVWNWAATLAFPDLGKEGNLAGVIVGMEPTVRDSSIDTPGFGEDEDDSLHIEAFYQYRINDNVAITPGVVWVTAPGNNNNNDDLVIGTLRSTFNF